MKVPVIAIDLGTTSCRVAAWHGNKVEVISNETGRKCVPNYVSFSHRERFAGEEAKRRRNSHVASTVYNVKRLIGRRYNEKIDEMKKHLCYNLESDDSNVLINVQAKGQLVQTPEEITAVMLGKMKEIAEVYIGTNINNAVITVPGHFNDSQRQATLDAGALAGLNVMRIINEPSVAALTYALQHHSKKNQNILVFDWGGGKLDVSVVNIDEDLLIEVRSNVGDSNLGGEDFDNTLIDFVCQEFEDKFLTSPHRKSYYKNKNVLRRIKDAVEMAKVALSTNEEVDVNIDALYNGIDYHTKISRWRFEELTDDLLMNAMNLVDRAIFEAKLDRSDISEVILVGGTTQIPKIQQLLSEYFQKDIKNTVNIHEAVVYGAAIEAAVLSGDSFPLLKDVLLVDVASTSLGIKNAEEEITIIEKNSRIPCKNSYNLTAYTDQEQEVSFDIFEERSNLLGKFKLENIPEAPKGISNIEVDFDLDANGILKVSAVDKTLNVDRIIDVVADKGRLSHSDIESILMQQRNYEREEKLKFKGSNGGNYSCFKSWSII